MTFKEIYDLDKAFENGNMINKFHLTYQNFSDRESMGLLENLDKKFDTFNFGDLFEWFVHKSNHVYEHIMYNKRENLEEGLFIRHDKKVIVHFDFEYKDLGIYVFTEWKDEDEEWLNCYKSLFDGTFDDGKNAVAEEIKKEVKTNV